MEFAPIGFFRGDASRKYASPRQGVFSGNSGRVELDASLVPALKELAGFERIWLVFAFDRNGGRWHPMVRPPVEAPGVGKVGVFATRSPYRPNPIGLSCVKLVAVKGNVLEVDQADLLDGTPILDVKPYIPKADAFPEAVAGWVDRQERDEWTVEAGEGFLQKLEWLRANASDDELRVSGAGDLEAAAMAQLSFSPFDSSRKRVRRLEDGGVLSVRMFRIVFSADESLRHVVLKDVVSGYTEAELSDSADPYQDKSLHRRFNSMPPHG